LIEAQRQIEAHSDEEVERLVGSKGKGKQKKVIMESEDDESRKARSSSKSFLNISWHVSVNDMLYLAPVRPAISGRVTTRSMAHAASTRSVDIDFTTDSETDNLQLSDSGNNVREDWETGFDSEGESRLSSGVLTGGVDKEDMPREDFAAAMPSSPVLRADPTLPEWGASDVLPRIYNFE
jgi:hypothetical protein